MDDTGTYDGAGERAEDSDAFRFADTAPQPVVTGAGPRRPGPDVPATRRGILVAVAGVTAAVLAVGALGAFALNRAANTPSPLAAVTSGSAVAMPGLTPAASQVPDATSPAVAAMLPASQPTLVLGDSLGLIVYPWLADRLPDRYVSYAAEVGRSTPATAKALAELPSVPPVVIVSSGTNDGAAAVVEGSAREILDRIGAQRCVVWIDVARPPTIGDTQEAINAAIGRAAAGRPNVRILRWSEMVAAHPEWMGRDGIHPDDAGAQARADAIAAAAAACSPIDPTAPRAHRQFLPASIFAGPISSQYRAASPSTHSTSSRSASTSTPSVTSSATPTSSPSAAPSSTPPSTTPSTTTPGGATTPAASPPANPAAEPLPT